MTFSRRQDPATSGDMSVLPQTKRSRRKETTMRKGRRPKKGFIKINLLS
jgi:hypothetical protein